MNIQLAGKALIVVSLCGFLLVPLHLISETVSGRSLRHDEAVVSVAEGHAGAQSMTGPILVVPVVDVAPASGSSSAKSDQGPRTARSVYVYPTVSRIESAMRPGALKRGIHEVRVFDLTSRWTAEFDLPPFEAMPGMEAIEIGRPFVSFIIEDVRGIVGDPVATVDGAPLKFERGSGLPDGQAGIHAEVPPFAGQTRIEFAMDGLQLSGTELFRYVPLGASTDFVMTSTWPHPKFAGEYLPRDRTVHDRGFTARWSITALNSGIDQSQWKRIPSLPTLKGFSVQMVDPINIYSQTERAVKYGILFIALTFALFFLFEVAKRLRIHPVQYTFVGLALAMFFLLLVSLSEHIAFGIAYAIAAGACILLIGSYLIFVLKSAKTALGFGATLAAFYGALFGILESEDSALLLGAGILFLVLTLVMLGTRKIDWYGLKPVETIVVERSPEAP